MKSYSKLVILLSSLGMSISAYADRGFVTDFETNALSNNTGNIRQTANQALLGRACGPMSLLAIYNHYAVENTESPAGFVANQNLVESAVERLYDFIDTTGENVYHRGYEITTSYDNNGDYDNTGVWDLSYIAEIRNGWGYTAEFEASRNSEIALNSVILHLQNDRPVIVLTNGLYDVQHFIVVYEVNEESSLVSYFDPWTGTLNTDNLNNFINYWDSASGAYNYIAVY